MTSLPHLLSLSSAKFRAALRAYATGVTVVTCLDGSGKPVGLTVNSFSSVSLEPPLVLWSLNTRSVSRPAFEACTHFGVNVLASAQRNLAQRFSSRERSSWQGIDWQPGRSGVPLIRGAMAWFECAARHRYDEGDHALFIGQVAHCGHQPDAEPLLFFDGHYHSGEPLRSRTREAKIT